MRMRWNSCSTVARRCSTSSRTLWREIPKYPYYYRNGNCIYMTSVSIASQTANYASLIMLFLGAIRKGLNTAKVIEWQREGSGRDHWPLEGDYFATDGVKQLWRSASGIKSSTLPFARSTHPLIWWVMLSTKIWCHNESIGSIGRVCITKLYSGSLTADRQTSNYIK